MCFVLFSRLTAIISLQNITCCYSCGALCWLLRERGIVGFAMFIRPLGSKVLSIYTT